MLLFVIMEMNVVNRGRMLVISLESYPFCMREKEVEEGAKL